MRSDVEDHVNVVRFLDTLDETKTFGVRNRIRKGLRKPAITRKFQNAKLFELKRAEICSEVIKTFLGSIDHAVEIIRVLGIVINFQVYIAPAVPLNGVSP